MRRRGAVKFSDTSRLAWPVLWQHFEILCCVGAVDALLRLAKEAEAAGVVLEEDPVGALMAPEAAAGKAWQDAARDIMTALQVCLFAPFRNGPSHGFSDCKLD